MGSASRYWRLVRIDAAGQRKAEEIAIAKAFFHQQFADLVSQSAAPDAQIQKELIRLLRDESVSGDSNNLHTTQPAARTGTRSTADNTLENRELAAYCLRCFISHEIEQACVRLESTFGIQHGFTRYDVFPLVLNDDGQARSANNSSQYRSLASEILQTFDPDRAGLSTWVARQVRQHRELHQFLLEHGVYLASDWAILNDTSPDQLRRILSDFHALTRVEIEQDCHLLQGYHEVYRRDRLQQRQAGILKGKEECRTPTPDQLTRIAQSLNQQAHLNLSNERIMSRLQAIATQLRHYRIYVRGGAFPIKSLDDDPTQAIAGEMQAPEPAADFEEQNEFLAFYREQFRNCLDQAIEQVTSDRVTYLERKRQQGQPFLNALHLFHCQGRSMAEIAAEIGLQAQFQVSRLIKLKEFRADIRQRLLNLLGDRILDKARDYADPSRLRDLDQRVEAALDEQVSTVFHAAAAAAAVAKHHPLNSLFARRLCLHLDTRRGAS
ncbi:MAG: hypothetical protein HC866_06605 [Leptolyngbyaceae cyanobacterium RU_5_1]|nr:hypothetical protein [Leptolyngbyaceae cyanobacterium RU_5_1]